MPSKYLFMYFTNSELSNVSSDSNIKKVIKGLTAKFNSYPFIFLNENDKYCQIPLCDLSNTQLYQVLIIYDGSHIDINGNIDRDHMLTQEIFLSEFYKIENFYEKIFICYHEKGPINNKNQEILKYDKFIKKQGAHIINNTYYSTAINFIKADKDGIAKALLAFEGNPELESLIYLRKYLSLIPLKLTEQEWNEENVKNEFDNWDDKKKKKVELAIKILDIGVDGYLEACLYVETTENDEKKRKLVTPEEFIENLKVIEKKITQFSNT